MKLSLTKTLKINKWFILLLTSFSLSLSSCVKGTSESNLALLSFIHASPGLPPIDIFIGGTRINGDSIIAYNDTIPYRFVNSGILNVTVKKNISSITYISKNLEIGSGQYYSFFIAGKPDSATYVAIQDNMTKPAAGKAKLRFINLIPDSKPLDIRINEGSSLFTGQAFKSYTDFASIDPGTYNLQVFEQGNSTPIAEKQVIVDEGKFFTVWARGMMSSQDPETKVDLGVIYLK